MYIIGIVKGALTSRAGSISFSFFMALFPFLLFILNLIPFIDLIPFIKIQNFDQTFLNYIELFLPQRLKHFSLIYLKILGQNQGEDCYHQFFYYQFFFLQMEFLQFLEVLKFLIMLISQEIFSNNISFLLE